MARYVNGLLGFVGRHAAAPFSQSQSLLGGSDFQLELSLPQNSQQEAPTGIGGLGMGPGGLFEGLVDSQSMQQDPAVPEEVQQGSTAHPQVQALTEVGTSNAGVTAAQANVAVDSYADLEAQRAWRKALHPFDENHIKVGQYMILHKLGKGGFATVFLAKDTITGEQVAFKVTTEPLTILNPEAHFSESQAEAVQNNLSHKSWEYRCFKRETELYERLGCFEPGTENYGLPRCFDTGILNLGANKIHGYMTMQILGKTVYETDIYKRRLTDHARFVNIAQCMLRSLQFMHKKGVIHRDVKPGNFCFNLDSNKEPIIFCIDLGLSEPAPTEETVGMYQQFGGTPDYAPTRGLHSQYQGASDDLESLAFCLLELWNGKLHWDVTDSAKWPLDLYFEAMREANKHVQDSASDREELEWSERNLARMAVLRDRAYDDLVQQGGVPRFLVQWIKYVRSLSPCQEPNYTLLRDYIASSGGGVGRTALWDTRDAWRQTKYSNARKRHAALDVQREVKRKRGIQNQQAGSQETFYSTCEKLDEESLALRSEA